MNPSVEVKDYAVGLLYAVPFEGKFLTVEGLAPNDTVNVRSGTSWLYVLDGKVWHNGRVKLGAGMYACVNSGYFRTDGKAKALMINRSDYKGMNVYGGPLESEGRLAYIDGCTDSILVNPVKCGDPCLNQLHLPAGTNQTMHTHPSVRIGVVFEGVGECVTPFGNEPLEKGKVFVIHPENGEKVNKHKVGLHSFKTEESNLGIVAFHPDSDFGATDEVHPMKNRTTIEG